MKIYTRGGDLGETSLLGNVRKSKASQVFEVLGCLDELNAFLGVLQAEINLSQEARSFFIQTQKNLLKLGALTASDSAKEQDFAWLVNETKHLESHIDNLDTPLPQLKNFILPGGVSGGAKVHLARAVCRRLERELVAYYKDSKKPNKAVLGYINRFSDFLFVFARFLNYQNQIEDVIWKDEN